mgnify:CR=1 FL=1
MNFIYKSNSFLPSDISIRNIYNVKDDFHARFDALSRTYQYKLNTVKNPFLSDNSYYLKKDIDLNSSVENQFISRECTSTMHQLLNKLNEEQKIVLYLRHFEQMSYQEIAYKTGININTCLGRMRYALKNLHKMMLEKKLEL